MARRPGSTCIVGTHLGLKFSPAGRERGSRPLLFGQAAADSSPGVRSQLSSKRPYQQGQGVPPGSNPCSCANRRLLNSQQRSTLSRGALVASRSASDMLNKSEAQSALPSRSSTSAGHRARHANRRPSPRQNSRTSASRRALSVHGGRLRVSNVPSVGLQRYPIMVPGAAPPLERRRSQPKLVHATPSVLQSLQIQTGH